MTKIEERGNRALFLRLKMYIDTPDNIPVISPLGYSTSFKIKANQQKRPTLLWGDMKRNIQNTTSLSLCGEPNVKNILNLHSYNLRYF